MPKKRHQHKYSKPQSTAPAALGSSSTTGGHHQDDNRRGVNELLADLRRVNFTGQGAFDAQRAVLTPSLPPVIRDILQLPETPVPRPRRPPRVDLSGRRLPPGPTPPRSWVSSATNAADASILRQNSHATDRHALPDTYIPARGSFVDAVLQKLVIDWAFQKVYCQYFLFGLPTRLKGALFTYLGIWGDGVSLSDLRTLLLPAPEDDQNEKIDATGDRDDDEHRWQIASISAANEEFYHLDLGGSIGRSIQLRELSAFLFATRDEPTSLQDSWDSPAPAAAIPCPLLPNLTHLSLALHPTNTGAVSWKHLLSFCANLSTLTHLSLAFWPEPSLTPNAKLASFVSAQGRLVQYGGTGPYSHSLDNDWSEAIIILRRLSKRLYRLEHLDLTGCATWCPALFSSAEHNMVDWISDWGKVSTILLYPGYTLEPDAEVADRQKYRELLDNAKQVERHIRGRRAGRGRFITVEAESKPHGF